MAAEKPHQSLLTFPAPGSNVVQTTDESRKKRETESHSTQSSQMYHLLDSYNLGTNRAIFFVQPRYCGAQEAGR
jgi:hypothetical protein